MDKSIPASPGWLDALSSAAGLAVSLGLGWLALSQRLPEPPQTASDKSDSLPALAPCVMPRDGFWKGRIVGSESLDLDWSGAALSCAGIERPDGQGLRLFFAGHPHPGNDQLRFALGITASLADLAGREHVANLTVIDEASSQFFHSPGGRCFTYVSDVAPLDGAPGTYRVEGELYCAGAIPSVSGLSSVTLGDIAYAGRLTLDAE